MLFFDFFLSQISLIGAFELLDHDLYFESPASYGYGPYKNKGHRSLGSKDRVETFGRTHTTDRFTLPANSVLPQCQQGCHRPQTPPLVLPPGKLL